MKKIGIILVLSLTCVIARAQVIEPQQVLSFLEENGTVRLETEELDVAADTLVTVQHRKDDVVWSRMVYRVIDLRFKQNFQLYFPVNPDDPVYMSLFRLMVDAIEKGMPVYDVDSRNFKPSFVEAMRVKPENYRKGTYFVAMDSEGTFDTNDDESFIISYDSVNSKVIHNWDRYNNFVRNQVKYLIQEVIFFDKHTSRLHRQLIAIAPLQPDLANGSDPMEFLRGSIRFWVLYKDLRPYLAKHYMIPLGNETKRVTFEEFFQKRMFTSYLVGERNMYNRMILDYAKDEAQAKKEQERIETEMLNFEQDLWEY